MQDVEVCEDASRVDRKHGAAKDRVISVADPQMRHGQRTPSHKSDGYKAHIATAGDNDRIIVDVEVTSVNAADSEPVPETVGKSPVPVNNNGLFTKDGFDIKETTDLVMCAAKRYAYFDPNRLLNEHKVVRADFKAGVCNNCKLKSRCTESSKGRTIRICPHEAKRRAKRTHQKTMEPQEKYFRRALTEQRISYCTRDEGQVSRFVSRAKTESQELLIAVNGNIQES